MRKARSIAILFLFSLPVSATAAATLLRDEASKLNTFIESDAAAIEGEENDRKTEASSELFPDDGTVIPQERTGDVTQQKGFVIFRINDVPYVLKDVPTSQWFAPYVRDVAEKGIVSGYRDAAGNPLGVFGPERNVTLEELSKMVVQAAKIDLTGCPPTPKNEAVRGAWSAPYVSCAEANGFAVYADGTGDLRRPATRAEVVVSLLQAFGRSIGEDLAAPFKDVNASTLFAPAIAAAVKDGIVSGYTDASGNSTGYFGPTNSVNRAEVAKMLSLALQVYAR